MKMASSGSWNIEEEARDLDAFKRFKLAPRPYGFPLSVPGPLSPAPKPASLTHRSNGSIQTLAGPTMLTKHTSRSSFD